LCVSRVAVYRSVARAGTGVRPSDADVFDRRMPVVPFSAATALTPLDPIAEDVVVEGGLGGGAGFAATVDAEWTIGGRPNGGYLLALLVRAAAAVNDHVDLLAASAHYLHSPTPGPAQVHARVLRAGRSASQVQAALRQDGQLCVVALLNMGELDDDQPFWAGGLPRREVSPRDECVRIPPRTPTGIPVAIMGQIDVRIDPRTLSWATGSPSGAGELRGWLALPDDEPFDPTSLAFAVDAFPPATFDIAASGWVPTLELTAYVRARPAAGPVQVLHRAGLIEGQRVDEQCFVWDQTGRLVAQSTQLAGIRLG
jgi:hypothetical protein